MRIFFEIENEPYACNDYKDYYQPVIDNLRSKGYRNKIVMGGDQGSIGKFVQNNGVNGMVNYTGEFPTDSLGNLSITLHNYFDVAGTGSDYPNQLTEAQTKAMFPSNTITTCMNKLKPYNIDLIYGEFGFQTIGTTPTNYQNNLASYKYVLDLMKSYVNSSTYVTQKGLSIDLTKSHGYFLGFSGWDILGDPNDTEEGHSIYPQTMTDFYKSYGYISNK
jgi:hypothetical protein